MPKWTKPSEAPLKIDDGDRVIAIIERGGVLSAHILWPHQAMARNDIVLWTSEKDLCSYAQAMKEAGEL